MSYNYQVLFKKKNDKKYQGYAGISIDDDKVLIGSRLKFYQCIFWNKPSKEVLQYFTDNFSDYDFRIKEVK